MPPQLSKGFLNKSQPLLLAIFMPRKMGFYGICAPQDPPSRVPGVHVHTQEKEQSSFEVMVKDCG
jgi:hypothetical protein